jgi:hypothetical protein
MRVLITLIALLAASSAYAEEAVRAVGTAGDTVVVFPWGQWVLAISNAFLEAAAPVIVAFIMGFIGKNYPLLKSFISEQLVENQVAKFVAYAENAEAGVVKGAHLDINVGQSVLGTAVARAIETANVNLLARKAVKWAGGPEAIAKKAFRRLHLDSTASAATVLVPVLEKIQNGTLLPEKIATVKVIPSAPTQPVPKVTPVPTRKLAAVIKRNPAH